MKKLINTVLTSCFLIVVTIVLLGTTSSANSLNQLRVKAKNSDSCKCIPAPGHDCRSSTTGTVKADYKSWCSGGGD
jgi:hypothetical protein